MIKKINKKLAIITLIIILISPFSCVFVYFYLSLPKISGTTIIGDLHAQVRVIRDSYGVPHIEAKNLHDLFYSYGYITAQDRLWQLDYKRRMAKGELSEVFGNVVLKGYGMNTYTIDVLSRTIGFYRSAVNDIKKIDKKSFEILKAYISGINAYIREVGHELPLEFLILNYRPILWEPSDSLAIAYLQKFIWSNGRDFPETLKNTLDICKMDQEIIKEVFPEFEFSLIVELKKYMLNVNDKLSRKEPALAGSNAWVIDGSLSKSGKPIIASDPHVLLEIPNWFHEVHLIAPGLDVMGGIILGTPNYMYIGRNKNIAWGFTRAHTSDTDQYIEKINPHNPEEYWHDNRWKKIETINEIIKIRNSEPRILNIRTTVHGTVISHLIMQKEKVISLKLAGFVYPGDEIEAFLEAMKAGSCRTFTDSFLDYSAPQVYFVVGDKDGNIAGHCAGRVPIREKGRGILLVPGWNDEYEWKGYIPFNELPQKYNPKEHYIASTNDRMVDKDYPYKISLAPVHDNRFIRINGLLQSKNSFDADDFQNYQYDVFSNSAKELMPLLLYCCKKEQISDPQKEKVFSLLEKWDYNLAKNSSPALIFIVFKYFLERRILEDTSQSIMNIKGQDILKVIAEKDLPSWYEIEGESDKYIEDIITNSFSQAILILSEHLGPDPGKWILGRSQFSLFFHSLSYKYPLLSFFNVGPYAADGGGDTLNNVSIYLNIGELKSISNGGVGCRFIFDLDEQQGYYYSVLPPGESGRIFTKHYRDQAKLWRDGRLKKVDTGLDRLNLKKCHVLKLVPNKDEQSINKKMISN